MKVFWLNKPVDKRELPLYRGYEETNNIFKVSIKEDSSFKYLWITNFEDSNHIYTVHNLQFRTEDEVTENNVRLFMSEENPNLAKVKQTDTLNISYGLHECCLTNYTELDTITDTTNLLSDNYVILLPKGSLIIEVNKNITAAELKIQYSVIEI